MRLIDADLLKENIAKWLKPSKLDETQIDCDYCQSKPHWCPLKSMPLFPNRSNDLLKSLHPDGYADGWDGYGE